MMTASLRQTNKNIFWFYFTRFTPAGFDFNHSCEVFTLNSYVEGHGPENRHYVFTVFVLCTYVTRYGTMYLRSYTIALTKLRAQYLIIINNKCLKMISLKKYKFQLKIRV